MSVTFLVIGVCASRRSRDVDNILGYRGSIAGCSECRDDILGYWIGRVDVRLFLVFGRYEVDVKGANTLLGKNGRDGCNVILDSSGDV